MNQYLINSYLSDPAVLAYVDSLQSRTQYVKITVLDSQDYPIRAIEGYATAGSINITNQSPVRRTGSLTMMVKEPDFSQNFSMLDIMYEVTNIDTLISMNKRIQLEIGIENPGDTYSRDDIDIFWFPLGIYIISNPSVTYNKQGISIQLKLTDKMALLNGEAGGVISMPVTHAPAQYEVMNEKGEKVLKDQEVPTRTLIKTFLHDYGNLQPHEYIIDDIPLQIKQAVYWNGDYDIYLWLFAGVVVYVYNAETTEKQDYYIEVKKGDYLGYKIIDFVYPHRENFTTSAGTSVMAALDQIKNTLGNYEFFFDLDGIFHFQEIKNYLNEGSSFDDITDAVTDSILYPMTTDKTVYSFTDKNATVFSNNPQYPQIKNDFVVWGQLPESELPLRYHLILTQLPAVNEKLFWKKTSDAWEEVSSASEATLNLEASGQSTNWRLKLYLTAFATNDQSAFAKELKTEFSKLFDLDKMQWRVEIPNGAISYWLDAIDAKQVPNILSDFSIENIGRQTKVLNDNNVNCIFASKPAVEKVIDDQNWDWGNVDQEKVVTGVYENSAYNLVRSSLHEHLSYNNNINLTAMPIYHLDVNQLIHVENNESDIHGDYMIQSISLPLTLDGMMTINARKATSRI